MFLSLFTPAIRPVATSLAALTFGMCFANYGAYAANISQPSVTSAQNAPLAATLLVSDIDADNFSVDIADQATYNRLNLINTAPLSVKFQKLSATSGRLVVTSTDPISEPFADVVLVINDNGKYRTIPKTLLLPLASDAKTPIPAKPPIIVSTKSSPNLPQTSGTPLLINKSNPPPLNTSSKQSKQQPQRFADDALIAGAPSTGSNQTVASVQTLTLQETRRIVPSLSAGTPSPDIELIEQQVAQQPFTQPLPPREGPPSNQSQNRVKGKDEADYLSEINTGSALAEDVQDGGDINISINAQNATDKRIKDAQTSTLDTAMPSSNVVNKPPSSDNTQMATIDASLGQATYRIEKNDNLWTIASQIASRNDVSIQQVMDHIVAYNPDSFVNGDKSKMLAYTTLQLPSYEVIPSQLGVKAAKKAKRQAATANNAKQGVAADNPNKAQSSDSNDRANLASQTKTAEANKRSVVQTDRRTRLTLMTPDMPMGDTATSSLSKQPQVSRSLLQQLQAARQQTASQASRIRQLNDQLNRRTQQLQIHNQRLADLERRLNQLQQQQ